MRERGREREIALFFEIRLKLGLRSNLFREVDGRERGRERVRCVLRLNIEVVK